MARYRYSMVYVEKIAPHSFLLFVDDKISTKLRDFSSGREVELGQPSTQSIFSATTEGKTRFLCDPHTVKDPGHWYNLTMHYNGKYLGRQGDLVTLVADHPPHDAGREFSASSTVLLADSNRVMASAVGRWVILLPSSGKRNWSAENTDWPKHVKQIFAHDAAFHSLQPSQGAEQWKHFLAAEYHWRTGYSARSLAYCWEAAQGGFPLEVVHLLDSSPGLMGLEMLFAIPEHQVPLPGGKAASQNDIWILGQRTSELVSMAVEGKVAESFGPTMEEWLGENPSPGKRERLDFLCSLLGLSQPLPGTIRYQLLHRTASALIEAQRFQAGKAVMIVHSFSQQHEWFEDFARFTELFGMNSQPGVMTPPIRRANLQLYLGWVRGDARWLKA
ncbi:MAG: hypothetical protein HQM06_16440 [Magnetococcales bacterium]|nr:hypothetical protein [Magnetococcales bacterium]